MSFCKRYYSVVIETCHLIIILLLYVWFEHPGHTYRGFGSTLLEPGYDKWYQSYVDHRLQTLLDRMLLRKHNLQNYFPKFYSYPCLYFLILSKLLSYTLLFPNFKWFILAAQPASALVINPLVSWHLGTCHSRRSHNTTHHSMHLRMRLLALIKHRFHAPTNRINVQNNYVFTLSNNLVPQV
jgi:hypothetical protein